MTIITDLDFFQTVYLITDPEQLPRQVTEIEVRPAPPGYCVAYFLSCGTFNSAHYRDEIATEPNSVTKIFT